MGIRIKIDYKGNFILRLVEYDFCMEFINKVSLVHFSGIFTFLKHNDTCMFILDAQKGSIVSHVKMKIADSNYETFSLYFLVFLK